MSIELRQVSKRFGTENRDGYQHYTLPSNTSSADGSQLANALRTKPVFFRLPERLVPAYYIEAQVRDGLVPHGLDSYAYVVSAEDLSVLFRNNQTADVAFSYRVFAETGAGNLPLPSPSGQVPQSAQSPWVWTPGSVSKRSGMRRSRIGRKPCSPRSSR